MKGYTLSYTPAAKLSGFRGFLDHIVEEKSETNE